MTYLGKIFSMLVVLICSTLIAFTQTREELQKKRQELEKEIEELRKSYAETQNNKKASLKQLALIKRKINAREDLVNGINREVRQLDETIYLNERDIYRLKKELDTLRVKYAKSIVFAYKNRGSYEYLNFLFSATNFNDAIKRMAYLKSYRQNRETQANAIAKSEQLLTEKISVLSANKKERLGTLEIQNKQLKVLQEDKKEQDQVVAQLKGREKELASQMKEREKQRQKVALAVSAAIRRELEEAKRREDANKKKLIEDQKKAQAKNDVATNNSKPKTNTEEPVTGVTTAAKDRSYSPFESTPEGREMSIKFENNRGKLPWPVSNGIITVDFGITKMEGTKLDRKSDGIEIAVPVGTSVRSVADGEVILAGEVNGENIIMIKHGKYFTGYQNLSSVNVSRGQEVKAGSLLGKSGTSIDGDGAIMFLIFNERSQPQNPKTWLKSR
jgi:septal ring factor EnvC (AmiA/AmiB activator)